MWGMREDERQDEGGQDAELEKFADRTRRSLILRLADWQDRKSWGEFYRTYWRPIYSVAIKAGLKEHEAWDVVQDVILTIAKQTKKNAYDPERGSFKSWLRKVTGWRINDLFRARNKDTANVVNETNQEGGPVENIADTESQSFDDMWDREWQRNVMVAALERVKMNVSPKQFQIFDYHVIHGMKPMEVRRKLGVSVAQVYIAKHRVGKLLKKEIEFIKMQ